MFELLPKDGLRLPGRAGLLRFGLDERGAQWAVATLADVRGYWVCGAGWAFAAEYRGLSLCVFGDTVDRYGRGRDNPGLAGVSVLRHADTLHLPSAEPVALDDIDLLGHPADEVLAALDDTLPPNVRPATRAGGRHLAGVHLSAPAVLVAPV